MLRIFLLASALNGFLAVALGAFGAHGLQARLAPLPDAAARLQWWSTASDYHLAHALALGLVGLVARPSRQRWLRAAGGSFLGGIALFCGSLYVMAVSGVRALGAITPIGGLLLLAGWAALAVAAFRFSRSEA